MRSSSEPGESSGLKAGQFSLPDALLALVAEQAADEGLWFFAQTAPEGYLQQELRRLHAMVELLAELGQTSTETKGRAGA